MCQYKFEGTLVVLLIGLLFAVPALADPPDLKLEIIPTSVEVGPDDPSQVTVVLRNPSDQPVTGVKLTHFTNTEVDIKPLTQSIQELSPNSAKALTLTVSTREDEWPDAGKVYVRVDYQWRESDENTQDKPPVDLVQLGSFEVTVPQVPAVSDVADVEIRSTLTALNEQRPGTVFLLMENKRGVPLEVVNIKPHVPSFVKIEPQPKCIFSVGLDFVDRLDTEKPSLWKLLEQLIKGRDNTSGTQGEKPLPKELNEKFKEEGYDLAEDASYTTDRRKKEWTVTDGDTQYKIRREDKELCVYKPESEVEFKMDAREKAIVPFDVSATDVVRPGKHLLAFEIELKWQEEGQKQESTLIASHEVDVGVFGESEILTLLGVPAFFLLPGFLLLVVLRIFILPVKRREDPQATMPFPLDITVHPTEFAAVAITISRLM